MRLTLDQTVADRLSSRLETEARHPVAVALSGGGDSLALLHLAADWARPHGRPLLALTVDHGLSADSAGWSDFAGRTARGAGAGWLCLPWLDEKPVVGLPAAARSARHRLIADAARAAGARVVLFAHTADDVDEGEVMRAEGSTLGRLRAWAPSPAWPEGRGLMIMRPLLDVRRQALRDWLRARGAGWIDDPANEDTRFARSRARQALATPRLAGEALPPAEWPVGDETSSSPLGRGGALYGIADDGRVALPRTVDRRTLAAALVCVGGGDRPPRADRLDGLLHRLTTGDRFTASLCGARIGAEDDRISLAREAGEFLRRPSTPLTLSPGVETVWDGRWAITVQEPGWSVAPAAGRRASLSEADRATLAALPGAARGSIPVLIRNDGGATVLAWPAAGARSLVARRMALALDGMTHERDLNDAMHGASPRNPLFST